MCGIAGIFRFGEGAVSPDRCVLASMASAIAHRGPDGEGIELGEGWGLAHRRLSVIGLRNGAQPMPNEDRSLFVSFNGEIYNYRSLRKELEANGHRFSYDADTEVLLHGYEEWGVEGLLGRLKGMFAFGLVDITARRLILARDRLGQKPLVYAAQDDGVSFASELQALTRVPGLCADIDHQAMADYLSLLYVPAPATIYSGVRKLPPACYLVFEDGQRRPEPKRYWNPCFLPKVNLQYADAVAETRRLLEKAVARRLESEVPFGAFLSGGIDSSIVTALMQKQVHGQVKTFTIGFDEAAYDERKYAAMMAADIGTEHHLKVAGPEDIGLIRRLIRHHGEPFADSSMIPTALLTNFAREHVTVVHTGDGADELFGGYQRYQVMALMARVQVLPQALRAIVCQTLLRVLPKSPEHRSRVTMMRRLLEVMGKSGIQAYAQMTFPFGQDAKRQFLGGDPKEATSRIIEDAIRLATPEGGLDAAEAVMAADMFGYLPGDILAKVDIAAMMVGLESRSPFLDHELIEFVSLLPRQWRVTTRTRKGLLLDATEDLMPELIRARGKRGFGVPVGTWMRGSMRSMIETLPDVAAWDRSGMIQGAPLQAMIGAHLEGKGDFGPQLWSFLCLKIWNEETSG